MNLKASTVYSCLL